MGIEERAAAFRSRISEIRLTGDPCDVIDEAALKFLSNDINISSDRLLCARLLHTQRGKHTAAVKGKDQG